MVAALTRRQLLASRLSESEERYFAENGATVDATVVVKGAPPIIYNPFNASLSINAHTVINSDNHTSFVPIASPVKFALGDEAKIIIGKHCDLNGCTISAYQKIEIGDFVQIGSFTWIVDSDLHAIDPRVRRQQLEGELYDRSLVLRAEVRIEDDVWIGSNVLVMKGVCIGRGSVIGAGSIVLGDIPAFSLAVGNPARVVGRTVRDY
jgi:acetyltransferase-like isoleucine patch superfamily enzyme